MKTIPNIFTSRKILMRGGVIAFSCLVLQGCQKYSTAEINAQAKVSTDADAAVMVAEKEAKTAFDLLLDCRQVIPETKENRTVRQNIDWIKEQCPKEFAADELAKEALKTATDTQIQEYNKWKHMAVNSEKKS